MQRTQGPPVSRRPCSVSKKLESFRESSAHWRGNPPILRSNLSISGLKSWEIATPVCGLVRNDRFFDRLICQCEPAHTLVRIDMEFVCGNPHRISGCISFCIILRGRTPSSETPSKTGMPSEKGLDFRRKYAIMFFVPVRRLSSAG